METDGLAHCALAQAARGLAALPPGTVGILGLEAQDINASGESRLATYWRDCLDPPASRDSVVDEDSGGQMVLIKEDTRARRPMSVFYRACQGHSCFVPHVERMH
eukprot:1392074-Pyramimonas_sp.AAC.1